MAPNRTRVATAAAARGGGSRNRSRLKLAIDLSSDHDGWYADTAKDGDNAVPALRDEDLEMMEEDDFDDDKVDASGIEESEDEEETVDAKRLRLAREYLTKMDAQESPQEERESHDDESDVAAGRVTTDKVGSRMARDRLRKSGLLQSRLADSIVQGVRTMRENIANQIGIEAASQAWMVADAGDSASAEKYAKTWLDAKYVSYHRGHDLTPTCVTISHDGHIAFSGSKDGSLIMWNVEEGKKISTILSATKNGSDDTVDRSRREILAVAMSDDGRYLAAGGSGDYVRIFDIRTLGKTAITSNELSPIKRFEGHKSAITALTFRQRTLDLYSASDDRCIRRYDLNAMTYVETLYGHQSPIVGMDCANRSRPVSVSRDRTVRVWKVEEDSHLVFRPGGNVGSAECVSALQDGWFITGHDDGRLALWKEEKKRPVGEVVSAAHGHYGGPSGVTRSVMCCDMPGLSDLLATGSNDGYLRLWRVSTAETNAGINLLDSVPIHGHINGIAMFPGGRFCVAAVGQEPRLGRWDRIPRAKNRFAIIQFDSSIINGG